MHPPLPYIPPPRIRDLSETIRTPPDIAFDDVASPIPGQRLRNDTDFLDYTRVPFQKLLNAYATDPLAHASVDIYASIIAGAGVKVTSDDKSTQESIDELMLIIGRSRFDRVFLHLAPLQLGIYGNAWVEHMMNGSGQIGNYTIANPMRMDFIRIDESFRTGPIVLSNGEEAGYVQWNDETGAPHIQFTREQMTHLHMNQVHIGELGFGLVESMFTDIKLKQNMEQALTASAHLAAFRRPVFEYGDTSSKYIEYHPNARLKKTIKRAADDIVFGGTNYVVLPPTLKPSKSMPFYEPGKLDAVHMEYLKFQARQMAGVARIPLAFLLQSGDASARDIEVLFEMFIASVKSFQRNLKIGEIIGRALESRGMPAESIKVRSGPISERVFKDANLGFLRGVKGLVQVSNDDVTSKFGTPDIDISEPEFKQALERALGIGREHDIIG